MICTKSKYLPPTAGEGGIEASCNYLSNCSPSKDLLERSSWPSCSTMPSKAVGGKVGRCSQDCALRPSSLLGAAAAASVQGLVLHWQGGVVAVFLTGMAAAGSSCNKWHMPLD